MKHPQKLGRLSTIKRDQREALSRIPFRRCDRKEFSRVSDALVRRLPKEAGDFRIGRIIFEDSRGIIHVHAPKVIAVSIERVRKAVRWVHPDILTAAPSATSY